MPTIEERLSSVEGRIEVAGTVLQVGASPSGGGGADPAVMAKLAALEEAIRRMIAIEQQDEVWHDGEDRARNRKASRHFILELLGDPDRKVGDGRRP